MEVRGELNPPDLTVSFRGRGGTLLAFMYSLSGCIALPLNWSVIMLSRGLPGMLARLKRVALALSTYKKYVASQNPFRAHIYIFRKLKVDHFPHPLSKGSGHAIPVLAAPWGCRTRSTFPCQTPLAPGEPLRVLLSEEGIILSAKSIDRVIGRLKARGVLCEAVQPRKAIRWHQKRLRRPRELVVDRPGALVQMDSKHVAIGNGKVVYQFGAVELLHPQAGGGPGATAYQSSWRRVLEAGGDPVPLPGPGHTVGRGERVPQGVRSWRLQKLQLTHYFNRPNYPQGNGRIERSFRTDEEEFYQVEDLPADLGGLEQALLAWNRTYETVRPHQALGYKTPDQFYRQWLNNNKGKEALSDIS